MKNIPTKQIAYVAKKIFIRACIIFTVTMFLVASAGYAISQTDAAFPLPVLMSLLFALLVSVSSMVFELKILPAVSRHILFFALVYVILMFLYLPTVLVSITSRVTFYFSIIYVIMYLICAGIYFWINHIIRRIQEKQQNYESLFDKANKGN